MPRSPWAYTIDYDQRLAEESAWLVRLDTYIRYEIYSDRSLCLAEFLHEHPDTRAQLGISDDDFLVWWSDAYPYADDAIDLYPDVGYRLTVARVQQHLESLGLDPDDDVMPSVKLVLNRKRCMARIAKYKREIAKRK